MEAKSTSLSVCNTLPLPSFLWSVLPLRRTCGIYRDGCVSQTLTYPEEDFTVCSKADTDATCHSGGFDLCICFPGINPSLWDKEDVAHWLHWAQKEYSLRRPEKGRFEMNGRALCLLTKEDFRRRCPSSGGIECRRRARASHLCDCVVMCTPFFFHRWCPVWDPAVCKAARKECNDSLSGDREHPEPGELPDPPAERPRGPASHSRWQPRSVMSRSKSGRLSFILRDSVFAEAINSHIWGGGGRGWSYRAEGGQASDCSMRLNIRRDDSTDFTQWNVFTRLGEYHCMATQWLSRIAGNLGTRFWKAVHLSGSALLQHCSTRYQRKNQDKSPLFFIYSMHSSSFFQNLVAASPIMQLSCWVTWLEAIYQITCSFLLSRNTCIIIFSHMQHSLRTVKLPVTR